MPNSLTASGLTIKSASEIAADLTAKFQAIYGADINVDQSSPDGQMIETFAQSQADVLENVALVYSSFSISGAFGASLDQRVALNGLTRIPGSFTFVDIVVTTTGAVTLPGLDSAVSDPDGTGFTIADDAGNQFVLVTTHVFGAGGVATLSFRAKKIGRVETVPNTITNQVTVYALVTSVNNPAVATVTGQDEETDAALRVRHGQALQLAATGPADSIRSALLNVAGVTDAYVAENTTGSTANGVVAHGIWAIVEGGLDADVANAIYRKKAPGCAYTGTETVVVVRPQGNSETVKYDRPLYQSLTIKFTLVPFAAGVTFDNPTIKSALAAALVYRLGQSPNIGDVLRAMTVIQPDAYLTGCQVSKNGGSNWFDVVAPDDFQHKFTVDTANITIT